MTLTRQEIFDKAWTGLKGQGFQQSITKTNSCRYRGPRGLKCAIGHLISDEEYSKSMEGKTPVTSQAVLRAAHIADEDTDFADSLQTQHDCAEGRVEMEKNLRLFARQHSLTIPGEPS